jgi:hypothetical protein
MQALYNAMKPSTKNEYFPKYILFSTIYLMQEQKLNPNKYSEQDINMIIFYKLMLMMCTCMQCLEA